MTEWEIKGTEFVNCNCIYACPCQFNALPDKGFCEAIGVVRIEHGHHGGVRLDDLCVATIYKWPGAVHQGNGDMQVVIDERADASQRAALLKIVTGEDTAEMATMWWVFSTMSPNKQPPRFLRIDFDVDVDARRGRVEIPGVATMSGEPIRNPVTGDEHRVRIDFPRSFEFAQAEIGSGTSKIAGVVAFNLEGTYGQFAHVHLGHGGRMN